MTRAENRSKALVRVTSGIAYGVICPVLISFIAVDRGVWSQLNDRLRDVQCTLEEVVRRRTK